MKRFIAILLSCMMIAIAIPSMAQETQTVALTNPNGLVLDTVSNTTPEAATIQIKGKRELVSFVLEVTKISGTVGGTVVLQGSNRANVAASYATIGSSITLTDVAAQSWQFSDVPKKFAYYRLLITGTGTMSASYRATAYTVK